MPINTSHKISPLEPIGGLQRIRLNPADAWFCVFLAFLWADLCHRSISQFYGFPPALDTESIICDCLRLILSTATNLGLNIVMNLELGQGVSIFHKVTTPSNDCESFALTALFALCFFSLRRFIGQGVIFLITPAFNYYVGLAVELLEAVVDEIMYPPHVVAGMHRHRQQVTRPPLTPPPPPIKNLTTRETCLNFQRSQPPSSGAGPSLPKDKKGAAIHRNKLSPNSARPGGPTTPSRSYHLDESPLTREEMMLYIEEIGMKGAHTIQSQPKYRGLFRLSIPRYLAEREYRVGIHGSDSEKAPVQDTPTNDSEPSIHGSTIAMTASVPDIVPQSTSSAEIDASPMDVSPVPPLVNLVVQDAPASSPVMPLVSNSLVIPNEEGESAPAPVPAPVPLFKALDKGKGRARPSNLFIPKLSTKGSTLSGTTSAPKIPSCLSNSSLPPDLSPPVAEIPVVVPPPASTPPAPSPTLASVPSRSFPAPSTLDKGKGRATPSNLFIPKPPTRSLTLSGTTSASSVPSRLSNSSPPAYPSPQAAEIPVVVPPPASTPPAPSPTPASVPAPSSLAPSTLDKGKGRATPSNLFIPKPPTKSSALPNIASAPKIPSPLSNATVPGESSSSAVEIPVVTPAPTPNPAPTPAKPTAPASVCLTSPIAHRPQVPDFEVDAGGDCIMVDAFDVPCIRSIEIHLGAVAPLETVVEMEAAQDPAEPEAMEMAAEVLNGEHSQGLMDSEDVPQDTMSYEEVVQWCLELSQTEVMPLSTEANMAPLPAELVALFQEMYPQEQPVPFQQDHSVPLWGEEPAPIKQEEPAPIAQEEPEPTTQEVPVPFSLTLEPAAETAAPNVTIGEGLVPQQAIIQSSTPLPFAILANAPLILPNAQPGPSTPRVQRAVNTFTIDTDILLANFSKPKPEPEARKVDVSIQSSSGSAILTQISDSSLDQSQTQVSKFPSPVIGPSLTCSDEKNAQTKSVAASGSAPLVVPRYGEMGRVRRFSPASHPLTKKSTAAGLSEYVPIRLLDEEDILPKEQGGDSEFEDDD